MRFFIWVLTLIAAIIAAVQFSALNPDPVTLKLSPQSSTQVTPIYLVLACIAAGAGGRTRKVRVAQCHRTVTTLTTLC